MAEAPTGGIFVSYARDEARAPAKAVVDRLRAEFGSSHIHVGSDELSFGEGLAESLDHKLQSSQVMLVLIGSWWLQEAPSTSKAGRWLEHEDNFARYELRTALQRGMRVVPVLLDHATFPLRDDLPADLQALANVQAVPLRETHFDEDMARLVADLRQLLWPFHQRSLDPLSPRASPKPQAAVPGWRLAFSTSVSTTLNHTRRRVAQVLRPLGGEVIPAITAWRIAYWLLLAALLLWGVVWPYLWPALMPAPAAVATTDEPLPAATGPVLPVGTRFRDCRDATCPWLRVLPAGTFTMGSPDDEPGRDKDEGPQHQVTVTKPFAVMETEVTVGLFKAFVAETGYEVEAGCRIWDGTAWQDDPATNWRKPFAAADQADDHPVVCVSWNTARAFARWMTKRTGQPYRLLSEAEWEYAARGGSQAAYSFGADAKQLCRFANVGDLRTRQGYPQWGKDWVNAECDDGHVYTAPVGSYQPNAFGLYDMHGNAWEWVQDCQNDYKAEPRTAEAVESTNCANRLLRGGGWDGHPGLARSANRFHFEPSHRNSGAGFRLARMLP